MRRCKSTEEKVMNRFVLVLSLMLFAFAAYAAIPAPTAQTFGAKAGPVNAATGNFAFEYTDLVMPGRGLSVAFSRSYNSLDGYRGSLGLGWTHSYNVFATENADASVTVKHGDGHEDIYLPAGGGAYTPQVPGVYDTLVKNPSGGFALTDKDQNRYQFAANGALTSLNDSNGNTLNFNHDGDGKLTTIADAVGRTISLGYDGSGHLTSLVDSLGRTVTYQYDANGNLISDTDPKGGVMRYAYDQYARLLAITDRVGNTVSVVSYDLDHKTQTFQNGRGYSTTFAYDTPSVRITTVTDARGGKTLFAHDESFRLASVTDPLNHAVLLGYDGNNNLSQVTDRNGNIARFAYDSRGNLLTGADASGNVTNIEYDANNNLIRIVDALNHVTAMAYDAKGNLTEVKDALGGTTRIAYDGFGLPVAVTDARGNVTTRTYDSQGNLIKVRDVLGHETVFGYNALGLPLEIRNAKGQATTFAYDSAGNLLSATDPLGHSVTFAYDANDNRLSVTDPRGSRTLFAYDEEGQPKTVTDPLGQTTTFTYDELGNRKTVKDARDNLTVFDYDGAENLIRVTDALGKSVQLVYDANGNLGAVTSPLGQTTNYLYDVLNRLTQVTNAMGHQTKIQYDALDRIVQIADAAGRTTKFEYDALDRLTRVIDAAGSVAEYAYDEAGNRTAVKDHNGGVNTFAYDALDRLVAEIDGVGNIHAYVYDAVGNLAQLTDAKGQTLNYVHDAADRLSEIRYPDGSKTGFGYDAAGNRIGLSDSIGNSVYEYDALSRLVRYTDPFNQTVRHEYDAAGNRTGLVYPGGQRASYAYDALNRLRSVADWLGGVTNYSYDDAGRLVSAALPNGSTATYAYDAADRLTALIDRRADGAVISSYELTLDAVGNRTHIRKQEPLSPVFLRKAESALYDSDNRLLEIGGAPATHDANGNLTAMPGATYRYDFEDRLIQALGAGVQDYRYNGEGDRLQAVRNGETTRYALDLADEELSHVLGETDASGNPRAYYVHGHGLISRIRPEGEARYYHYDPVGSAVALTNPAGQVTDSYAYDPFGLAVGVMGTTNNPFRFVGQFGVMDEGGGLLHMRHRCMNAYVGRFINKDPLVGIINNSQSMNRYIYAFNNPMRFVDYKGLSAEELISKKMQYDAEAAYNSTYARELGKTIGIVKIIDGINTAIGATALAVSTVPVSGLVAASYGVQMLVGAPSQIISGALEISGNSSAASTFGTISGISDWISFGLTRKLSDAIKPLIDTFGGTIYNGFTGNKKVTIKSIKTSRKNGVIFYEATVKINGIKTVIKATGKSSSPSKSKSNKGKGSSTKSTPPKYTPKPGIVIAPPPPPPPQEPVRTLTITDPSPGEEWDNDKEHTVNWVTENVEASGLVRVYYSLNDGATWHLVNADYPATSNDGSFRWSMWRDENICHDTWARVRIISVSYPWVDVISAPFYIDYKRGSNNRC
jgi:RHS repeat-associated protein